MLFSPVGSSKLQRIQGAYIDEEQILELTEAWRAPGRARVPRGVARGGRDRATTAPPRTRTRCQRRRGSAAGGGDLAGGPDGNRLHLDAPAPPAAGLHAGRAPDRHARAARDHLRLRGLQAAPGADQRGRRAADPLPPGGGGRSPPVGAPPACGPAAAPAVAATPLRRRARGPTSAERAGRYALLGAAVAGRYRRHTAGGADARQDRHQRGRGAHQDPGQVPPRDRERGMGPPPGRVYVKSFLRTYGDYLGLDTRQLLDDFRRIYERPSDHEMRPIAPLGRERDRPPRRPRVPSWLIGRRGAGGRRRRCCIVSATATSPSPRRRPHPRGDNAPSPDHRRHRADALGATVPEHRQAAAGRRPARSTSAWSTVAASKLIAGQIFNTGQTIPTETSPKLLLTLGNAQVKMKVNGAAVKVHRLAGRSATSCYRGRTGCCPPPSSRRCA